jgi:HAD superfamily hydrolase (TIGR01509 family)
MLVNDVGAVIFDMDGVISDTQSIYAHTESQLLAEHGIDLTPEEITFEFSGSRAEDMMASVWRRYPGKLLDLRAMVKERRERISAALKGNIRAVPGTIGFLKRVKAKPLPTAVGSATRLAGIKNILAELGIQDDFDAIASGEEVENGKPAPDVFLLAAERLKVPPARCLVIEDGAHGMIAARRAGMRSVGLVRSGELDKDAYPADYLVRSLDEVEI